MSSKIEQIIDEIEDFISGCKFQAFSGANIIVDKEHLEELLRELRMKTPDEIKRYQKIISNKEAILNDAKEKAEAMINEAQIHTDHMVNEHEIMQQAYAQANEVVQQAVSQAQQILDTATNDANGIRQSAMKYTDDMLAELQGIIKTAIGDAQSKYTGLLERLKNCETIIDKNRSDLYPQVELEKEIASIEGTSNKAKLSKTGGISLDMLNNNK
ncbi:MAG: vacuolar family H+-ATPase subunit H [Lachnospiraceae bacterium]|nr:vacuolar family H+-ATPase subunit H [Lachnospiraceae bacterium]